MHLPRPSMRGPMQEKPWPTVHGTAREPHLSASLNRILTTVSYNIIFLSHLACLFYISVSSEIPPLSQFEGGRLKHARG